MRNAGKPGFCGAECNGAEQKAAQIIIKKKRNIIEDYVGFFSERNFGDEVAT